MKTAKSKSKSKSTIQAQTDENKGAKNVTRQDKKTGVNGSIKIVYTVNANRDQSKLVKGIGIGGLQNTKPIVNKINLTKKSSSNPNAIQHKSQSKLSEVLERIYNDYNQKKDLNWMKVFKEEIVNDTNFSFDFNTLIVKSLNKQSSDLFDREMLWMLIVEYYINEAKCNTQASILSSVVRLFDQGLNFIIEPKNIMNFYYSTIAALSPGLKKEEMFDLLNANSKFLLDQEPNGKRPKIFKKAIKEVKVYEKEKVNLIESNEHMEFIPIAAHISNDSVNTNANANVNMIDLVNANKKEEEEENDDINSSNAEDTTLDEKCLSTLCNASSTVEYQHWLSPQLTHIKEEESEEKDKDKTKQKDYIPYDVNDDNNDEEDDIIPQYEQRKHLKVKELMKEIEGKMHSTDISTSTEVVHSLHLTGNKRTTATPSKIRFSPREEYPLDIVEGSIQKFNRSFTKN